MLNEKDNNNRFSYMEEQQVFTLEELYASKNYNSYGESLRQYVETYGEMKTAEMIINGYEQSQRQSLPEGTYEFSLQVKPYWERLKREFDRLVCGHKDYEEEQKKFLMTGQVINLATAYQISSMMTGMLSIPPYILTPAIALMLHTMVKMGRLAYCENVKV